MTLSNHGDRFGQAISRDCTIKMCAHTGPPKVEMIDAFDDIATARKLQNAIIIKVGVPEAVGRKNFIASDATIQESEAAAWLAVKKWSSDSFGTSLKASYTVHKLSRPIRGSR